MVRFSARPAFCSSAPGTSEAAFPSPRSRSPANSPNFVLDGLLGPRLSSTYCREMTAFIAHCYITYEQITCRSTSSLVLFKQLLLSLTLVDLRLVRVGPDLHGQRAVAGGHPRKTDDGLFVEKLLRGAWAWKWAWVYLWSCIYL